MSRSSAFSLLIALVLAAACDSSYTSDPGQSDGGAVDAASVGDDAATTGGGVGVDADLLGVDANVVDAATGNSDGGACGAGCHVMFVTSDTFLPTLGGQAGADQKCKDAAKMSKIPAIASRSARFVAWISTGMQGDPGMGARLPAIGTFQRPDGKPIARSVAELLSGMIKINIVEDESGSAILTGNLMGAVWTGTATNGKTSTNTCGDWSTTNGGGSIGQASEVNANWTDAGAVACNQSKHLYCLEQ